jgi:hypothetical protein
MEIFRSSPSIIGVFCQKRIKKTFGKEIAALLKVEFYQFFIG